MSALGPVFFFVPMPRLQRVGLRARLARAERAVSRPFTRAASLRIDAALLAHEAAAARHTVRPWRRAA